MCTDFLGLGRCVADDTVARWQGTPISSVVIEWWISIRTSTDAVRADLYVGMPVEGSVCSDVTVLSN